MRERVDADTPPLPGTGVPEDDPSSDLDIETSVPEESTPDTGVLDGASGMVVPATDSPDTGVPEEAGLTVSLTDTSPLSVPEGDSVTVPATDTHSDGDDTTNPPTTIQHSLAEVFSIINFIIIIINFLYGLYKYIYHKNIVIYDHYIQ